MPFYKRKSPRIPNYDYSKGNYYFVTFCTYEHRCIFGRPGELNQFGLIAQRDILNIPQHYAGVTIDKFVVMPNHIHMIIVLEDRVDNPSISKIIALYKTGVTKQLRRFDPNLQVWQRSFHDHIIRNQKGYEQIWSYIDYNPIQWEMDKFYRDCDEQ
jgi:REP element-mobilizing transposase RayT